MEIEVTIDRDVDAAYVYLTKDRDRPAVRQVFVKHKGKFDLVIDFDSAGKVMGIEVIGASIGLDGDFISAATDITGRNTGRSD